MEVTLEHSSNVVGDSNDENDFSHKLLLTNTQVSKLCKAFENSSSAKIKLSKSQLHKIGQLGGFLGRLLRPLLKTGLHLIGNVFNPLAKSVSIPVGLTAAVSATYSAIHKKMFGFGNATLIIHNEEINDIMKLVKLLEEGSLLIKVVDETTANEAKEQKGGFFIMSYGTLGASLLGNLSADKDTIRAVEGTVRADHKF